MLSFLRLCLHILITPKHNSVLLLQKLHKNGIYVRGVKLLCHYTKLAVVYDIDDADHYRYRSRNILHFIRRADKVLCGSKALQQFAKNHNQRSYYLGSPIFKHPFTKSKKSDVFHLGWIGDYGLHPNNCDWFGHKNSLEKLVFPALDQIQYPIKFTLLGIRSQEDKEQIINRFADKNHIKIHIPLNINWFDELKIVRTIRDFDLGVAPLIKSEFNRAKSAFKAKQYLSCGVPVVGSAIGENKRVIIDKGNGILAKSANDFKKGIDYFHALPPQEYMKYSYSAYKMVQEHNMGNYGDKLLHILEHQDSKLVDLFPEQTGPAFKLSV